uniref:Uncharacterized protein n=1 Tax=Tetranychus urticae TaxID=32264 RepID=T1KXH5_TETUR
MDILMLKENGSNEFILIELHGFVESFLLFCLFLFKLLAFQICEIISRAFCRYFEVTIYNRAI